VIQKLEAREPIEPEERVHLAMFIALLFNRVPKFEREIEQITDAAGKALMKEMFPTIEAVEHHFRREGDEARSFSAKEYFDFIHKEQYTIEGNRNITIQTMLEDTPEMSRTLGYMDWMIVHADDRSSFITTDSPFGFIVPEEIPLQQQKKKEVPDARLLQRSGREKQLHPVAGRGRESPAAPARPPSRSRVG